MGNFPGATQYYGVLKFTYEKLCLLYSVDCHKIKDELKAENKIQVGLQTAFALIFAFCNHRTCPLHFVRMRRIYRELEGGQFHYQDSSDADILIMQIFLDRTCWNVVF